MKNISFKDMSWQMEHTAAIVHFFPPLTCQADCGSGHKNNTDIAGTHFGCPQNTLNSKPCFLN